MADATGTNDELVSQFLAFTGSADTDQAASYLEMSGGNLETAVGLYMEHQAGGGAGTGAGGGSASAGAAIGGGLMGDDVRAPDATRSMRLMDDSYGGMMMGGGMIGGINLPPYMRVDPTLDAQLASSAFGRSSRYSDINDDDDNMDGGGGAGDDDEEEKADSENRSSRRQSSDGAGLADMFAPPHHLLFKEGGFEGARDMAKENRRWLLVNLQRDSEFACHALNRDVWRDELVENLIREGFVFWQGVS
jgi:UBX domain-containing protein 7